MVLFVTKHGAKMTFQGTFKGDSSRKNQPILTQNLPKGTLLREL